MSPLQTEGKPLKSTETTFMDDHKRPRLGNVTVHWPVIRLKILLKRNSHLQLELKKSGKSQMKDSHTINSNTN